MMAVNEMGPVNAVECGAAVIIILFSGIMTSQIFGEIAIQIQEMNKKETIYQMKLDAANTVLNQYKIPLQTQNDIRGFI